MLCIWMCMYCCTFHSFRCNSAIKFCMECHSCPIEGKCLLIADLDFLWFTLICFDSLGITLPSARSFHAKKCKSKQIRASNQVMVHTSWLRFSLPPGCIFILLAFMTFAVSAPIGTCWSWVQHHFHQSGQMTNWQCCPSIGKMQSTWAVWVHLVTDIVAYSAEKHGGGFAAATFRIQTISTICNHFLAPIQLSWPRNINACCIDELSASDDSIGLCDETWTPWGLLSKCALWGCSRLLGAWNPSSDSQQGIHGHVPL